jgi:hypothetical protein
MNFRYILLLSIFVAASVWADEQEPTDENTPRQEATEEAEAKAEPTKLTGAARRELEDQIVAEMVEEYNEGVEEDLDEVVCKREKVTGQRTKVRICKTRRQILADQAETKRALQRRNRSSAGPAQPAGVGVN